jgi:SAM-dependent methyltransferase
MTQDPYSALADLYDLDCGGFTADLAMYESFARRCELPVLEIGVGTGRVALHLAHAGFAVWGIDSSQAMLDRAQSKSDESLSERLHLTRADMRDLDLGRQFDLVICPGNSFPHLLTTEDQLQCLASVRRHLAEGGLFVVALRSLTAIDWSAASVPAVLEWVRTDPASGDTVTKLVSMTYDGARQALHQTHVYDRTAPTGRLKQRRIAEFDLRLVGRYEMEHLLRRSELELAQLYGDYELGPYTAESRTMVVVARRPKEEAEC